MADNKFSISDGVLTGYNGNEEEVIIPGNVTRIDGMAFFAKNELKKVVIHGGVKVISEGAFFSCNELSEVIIENGVETIETSAFRSCGALREVKIPESTVVQNMAFDGGVNIRREIAAKQPEVKNDGLHTAQAQPENTQDNVHTDQAQPVNINTKDFEVKDGVLVKYKGREKDIVIPEGVTSIGNEAFAGRIFLRRVLIPDSVTSIGEFTFKCSEVNPFLAIYGSDGSYAEEYAKQKHIFFRSTSKAFEVKDGVLVGYHGIKKDIVIPEGVTSIGDYAFNRNSLESVTIPSSVMSIGEFAFWLCISLKSVTIQNGVTSIGDEAFKACTSLEDITIPNSVKSIGVGAFDCCRRLKSATVPDSVTSIGNNAFVDCDSHLIIYGKTGSFAEKYAREWKHEFKAI